MRPTLIKLAALAFVTALLAFGLKNEFNFKPESRFNKSLVGKTVTGCSPDWNELQQLLEDADIPPIKGAGNYKWKINTKNDSAQFYFNQGINMYYSFHIIEAMASFKKAIKFDPSCPMLYWAQALAYGPNINDVGYAASPEALTAVRSAMERINNATLKEKGLIAAQWIRYSEDSTESREKLNQLYVDKMAAVYTVFNSDPDVAALYADALMLQHPWDLWKTDGTPKPWTPLIRNVLEKLLIKTPLHPGANHYYIHVMEPSPYPEKAKPSADRLSKLTPALSHTVHMPSHIYLRTGDYEKGIMVNESAIKSYDKLIPVFSAVTANDFLYRIHNLHMQTNHSLMAGRSSYSVKSARQTANSIPREYLDLPGAMGNLIQYIHMTPLLTDIRFGNWNSLLANAEPDPKQIYSRVLFHFGRGMALAATNRIAEAKHELSNMQSLMQDSSLRIPLSPFSPAIDGAIVGENLLAGSIALKEKLFNDAVNYFKIAVRTEDSMVYNEPRDWLINPKHYLANAYIKGGRFEDAIAVLQKDLAINRENGWALFGIWQALTEQNKKSEAGKILLRFRKSFSKSDIKLPGPVFD